MKESDKQNSVVVALNAEIAQRETELEHLRVARDILLGSGVTVGTVKQQEPPTQATTPVPPIPPEPTTAWTETAERLIRELPVPFKMADMHTALTQRGYTIARPIVSSWLSRAYIKRGLVQPVEGKRGLWRPASTFMEDMMKEQ